MLSLLLAPGSQTQTIREYTSKEQAQTEAMWCDESYRGAGDIYGIHGP